MPFERHHGSFAELLQCLLPIQCKSHPCSHKGLVFNSAVIDATSVTLNYSVPSLSRVPDSNRQVVACKIRRDTPGIVSRALHAEGRRRLSEWKLGSNLFHLQQFHRTVQGILLLLANIPEGFPKRTASHLSRWSCSMNMYESR